MPGLPYITERGLVRNKGGMVEHVSKSGQTIRGTLYIDKDGQFHVGVLYGDGVTRRKSTVMDGDKILVTVLTGSPRITNATTLRTYRANLGGNIKQR